MRSKFEEQHALLHKELITMGALCENAIALSAKALDEGNPARAREVFGLSAGIDQKERAIEALCGHDADGEYAPDLLMIAKYFERMGNHATNIAEWVLFSITGHHGETETKNGRK